MYNNDIETIKLLIENGADVNYELNDITPLVYSIMYKQDIEIIKLLSEKTKDIDYLALFALILIYDISKDIENLFRENITKDMINESLKELLITKENDIFSSKDMKEMIKEKKSIKNKVKKFKGDVEEIKNIGIETIYDGINNTYQSIENISEQQNDIIDTMNTIDKLDILKKLISDYDVKLDFEDEYKNALIIYASYSDNLEVIEFLVENGNDINHKNIEGCTPLSIAYKQYNIEIVEYLIKQRADVNIILENGKTLYESAKFNDNKELIELIENSPTFIQINPQRLVQILTNFTVDKPMKYTTHSWDFGELSKKYKDFDGYLNAVKSQWDGIKDELKELSPNLYQKVYNFLWETDSNKSLGWSSIDGLKEWCDNGNKPHNFKINDKNFEDIINEFKHQIEIRKNDNILENIFIQQRKKLGRKFKVELIKLKGKTFYTDVEKFKNALDKIFYEISQRQEFQNITVEDSENSRYLEIKITQIDSLSNTSAENMLKEAQDGDFADIKSSLTNLCDWSIESSDENNHYRVNYLKSDNIDDIQILQNKPEGFTHILRVYNK
jgi:ankyrin repeat protein